jgi:hypothetical protein
LSRLLKIQKKLINIIGKQAMSQKILPKENSVYTNASAESFQSATQKNARSSKGFANLGINGKSVFRELPTYNSIESSKILNNNNGYINICEDAPGGPGTGYSAFGTPASSVDIVCGRLTSLPEVSTTSGIYVNDGIGAQADVIALKGKTGIKLTTGQYGERNSKGGKIRSGSGIELIAGTYTENLQPLVLGDNMEKSLKSMIKRINTLSDIVVDLAQVQNQALILIQSHSHTLGIDPTTGLPGAVPSATLLAGVPFSISDNITKGIMNGTINKINLLFDDVNYLSSLGKYYINSDLNRTN